MSQVNIIASKLIMMDSNYNQGQGISEAIILETTTGSKIFYFINGFLVDPISFSGSPVNGGGGSGFTSTFSISGVDTYDIGDLEIMSGKTVTIDWGDGNTNIYHDSDSGYIFHDYSGAGNYTVVFESPENISYLVISDPQVNITINSGNPIPPNLTGLELSSLQSLNWNISSGNSFPSAINNIVYITGNTGIIIDANTLLNITGSTDIRFNNSGLNQSTIDSILQVFWVNLASFTALTNIDLRVNSVPSGVYQFSSSPSTGQEYKYALNNSGHGPSFCLTD
jgi:hypothetical protein